MRYAGVLLLLSALAIGWHTPAQAVTTTKPVVFLWAVDQETNKKKALGSGFVLGPEGHVLTAKHVVDGVVEGQRIVVTVGAKVGIELPVFPVMECSPVEDFCFLQIQQDNLATQNLTEFYRLGCYLPKVQEDIMAVTFFAQDVENAGVIMSSGKVAGMP